MSLTRLCTHINVTSMSHHSDIQRVPVFSLAGTYRKNMLPSSPLLTTLMRVSDRGGIPGSGLGPGCPETAWLRTVAEVGTAFTEAMDVLVTCIGRISGRRGRQAHEFDSLHGGMEWSSGSPKKARNFRSSPQRPGPRVKYPRGAGTFTKMEMNHSEIVAELKKRCESIRMELGVDSVQIMASSEVDDGETEMAYFTGVGSMYARIGLAHDFIIEQEELRKMVTRK